MGLFARFRSSGRTPAASPQGSPSSSPAPGAPSQPEGDGPVTLADRTEPGGEGSPDTNQARTEPMAPGHAEPAATPTLASTNVGAADPQAPSHPAAAPPPSRAAGSGPASPRHADGPGEARAHRAPGQQGTTPAGEVVSTDVEAGAQRMRGAGAAGAPPGSDGQAPAGSGSTGPSPATGDAPLAGTSEELPVVQGVRQPDLDQG